MKILDSLTLISYVALNIDVVLQIKRIHKTRSSKDLSLLGMTIRGIAIGIILIKFISLKSTPLIIGQGLIALTFAIYYILAFSYFRNRKES